MTTGDYPRYEDVIDVLGQSCNFGTSPELGSLKGNGDDLPGVVACAYAKYLARVYKNNRDKFTLAEMINPLNVIAEWEIPLVNVLLEDEVFEQFLKDGLVNNLIDSTDGPLKLRLQSWTERL